MLEGALEPPGPRWVPSVDSMPVEPAQATARRSAPVLPPGQVVGGRFQVEEKVSDDAIGTVLRARDQKTKRPIALRVLAPELTTSEPASRALRDECRVAAQLSHRNISRRTASAEPRGGRVRRVRVGGRCAARAGDAAQARKEQRGPTLASRRVQRRRARVQGARGRARSDVPRRAAAEHRVGHRAGRVKVGDFGVARAVLESARRGRPRRRRSRRSSRPR